MGISKRLANPRPSKSAAKEEPRFAAVLDAFRANPSLAGIVHAYEAARKEGPHKFGSDALKVNGKIFAMMSSGGRFVVKLSKERVDELVGARRGEYFSPGRGRVMKQWLSVTSPKVSWPDLAFEAHAFVKALK